MGDAVTHHFYIDDSGQRDYAKAGKDYDLRLTRHFVLGGVLLRVSEAARLSAERGLPSISTMPSAQQT
jgi:hypothetical protein